jgi:hypothetical protein
VLQIAIQTNWIAQAEHRVDQFARSWANLAGLPEFIRVVGLDVEQTVFYGSGAALHPHKSFFLLTSTSTLRARGIPFFERRIQDWRF